MTWNMMAIDRRDFLIQFAATVAAITGLKRLWALAGNANSLPLLAAQALKTCREYSGANFAGWEVVEGDALYACPGESPVTMSDIRTVHEDEYSELQANILRRCIMAHNITFKRVIDDRAFDFVHAARYEFRLPFLPSADINAQQNGQTVEGGLFIWDGKGTRFDYGMGFQITLNPWSNFGELNIWSTDESSDGEWEVVGKLDPDTEWHLVEMSVDFQQKGAFLAIDGIEYPAKFTKTKKPDNWAKETAARLQAEIVSIWPEPDGIKASHRVQFKDWNWAWKSESCHEAYLPVVMKQPSSSLPDDSIWVDVMK